MASRSFWNEEKRSLLPNKQLGWFSTGGASGPAYFFFLLMKAQPRFNSLHWNLFHKCGKTLPKKRKNENSFGSRPTSWETLVWKVSVLSFIQFSDAFVQIGTGTDSLFSATFVDFSLSSCVQEQETFPFSVFTSHFNMSNYSRWKLLLWSVCLLSALSCRMWLCFNTCCCQWAARLAHVWLHHRHLCLN